jgi:heptaprenyl diphosphate synthase
MRPPARSITVSRIKATTEDHRLAKLAALAIGLSVIDAAIPSPLPGIKPGFANIVTLLVLYTYGWRDAVWVTGLRVVAGSLAVGTFLSPTFALSLSGATFSLLTLLVAAKLPKNHFGPVGLSVLGAFAHMSGQLLIAYLFLIPHTGLVYLMPLLFGSALVFGIVNGIITVRLVNSKPA